MRCRHCGMPRNSHTIDGRCPYLYGNPTRFLGYDELTGQDVAQSIAQPASPERIQETRDDEWASGLEGE